MHIKIEPGWYLIDDDGRKFHASLLPLLQSLNKVGKLTKAAERLGISYRLAWNVLAESEDLFGAPLVNMEKGRGASLTALGQSLLWSHQRIEARLHPQLESLATELNVEVHKALADMTPVIRIFASHGYAVSLIPQYSQGYEVEMYYHSPQEALEALNDGRCKIAGFHQSIGLDMPAQKIRYQRLLDPNKFGIIRFVKRQQGLIYAQGNPHNITGLSDLERSNLRFINRQPNSGTRELLEQLLQKHSINASRIQGYENMEYTHSAIAAYISSNMADMGFGVEAAADRLGLDFLPVIQEYYLWAYPLGAEKDDDMRAFIKTLKNKDFQGHLNSLPGYIADSCGATTSTDWLFSQ